MKRILIASILTSTSLFAGLPRSAVSVVQFSVHGVYTTSDPTCQTGLLPTIPISATASNFNFVNNPSLGNGPVPSEINCVVMIIKNTMTTTWAAGNYTTSTGEFPDSVCNAGGSETPPLCNGVDKDQIIWPTVISNAMTAAGLTPLDTCNSLDQTMLVPLYLSTYSLCTGGTFDDVNIPGCSVDGNSVAAQFQPPVEAETEKSVHRGIKLVSPSVKNSYAFYADPDGRVGADNLGDHHCILGGLKFGFR